MDVAAPARERLSEAFREAYEVAGLSQQELSRRIGVDQTTISKYARGAVQPPLEMLPKVERACGHKLGYILRRAGFVEDIDTRTAILADPDLSLESRQALVRSYDGLRALAQ
ncbi:MAG TPA: helix-turn-helix transcriptional regulator [Thermobifida alba]|nr:helix-turn-helix transcriptional regulator [Thermobifida alba]